MIETILLIIPGLVLIWILVTYVEHLISLRKYPKGPFPLPLIGNVLLLSKIPYLDFIEMSKKYGDVFSLSLGMKRMVVINSYESIKEALITRGTDFAGRPHDSVPLKVASFDYRSLGSADYSKSWAFLRKLTYKSLHMYGSGMKNIEDIVIEEVEKMCSILSKEAGKPVLIHQYLGNSLVNTICRICFSKTYEFDDPEFQQILHYLRLINQGLQPGQPISIFPWLRFFPDTKRFKNLKIGSKFREEHIHRMFDEHIETFDPEKIRDVTDNLLYFSQNKEKWQDAGFEEVTQEQLEAVTHTLFFAGIETTLSSLRWLMIYLFHNPDVQTKIYEEIVNKVGLKRHTIADDMDSLPYAQASLLETHRCASITPVNVPHKTVVKTQVGGHAIPKDTQIFFNIYNIHNDPTHWNEPEKFKPDRWLNADGSLKKEKATHYLPFSAGTRVCIGERMAKMQMLLIVTRLLVNFEVSLAPGELMPSWKDGKLGLTFEPETKFKVVLRNRKH